MLHNSGAYGPNESPINASAPVNMSQVPTPLNMARSLQNMSDIAQQPLRGPTEHYNLPDYAAYNHQTLDMRSHFNTFSNHHLKGFPNEFLPQNSTSVHNTRWQNGMSPLNLNAQSTYVPNVHNFHSSYEKPQPNSTTIPSTFKAAEPQEKSNLNLAEPLPNTSNDNYFFNSNQDRFSHYNMNYDSNISKERPILDSTKRKSLENTVKLIENILINTTKDTQTDRNKRKGSESDDTDNVSEKSTSIEDDERNLEPETTSGDKERVEVEIEKDYIIPDDIDSKTDSDKEASTEIKNPDIETPSTAIESIIIKETSQNNDTVTSQDSVTPKVEKEIKIKIEINVEPMEKVNIKEEHVTDEEYQIPFRRDVNGILRENVTDVKIINSENSINEAQMALKSGSTSDHLYECPHCGLLFSDTKRFLIHTKWHTFGLTNEKRAIEAREREIQKKQRKEAKLIEQLNLEREMQRKQRKEAKAIDQLHKAIEEESTTFPCKDCTKIFCSKGSLKNHRTRFHSSRIRECNICGAVAMGWAGLKAHAATHDSPFRCGECGKQFAHKHSLARHAETHMEEQEKTLPCEICGKLFAVVARLKEHQRVHVRAERGATFQCSYCAKSFFQAYSLTIHERTHRNEKPYTCEICNASYGTNSSLKRHLKVSHNRSKPFECSQCGRCFISERALTTHIVRLHVTDTDDPDPLAPRKRRRRSRAGIKKLKKEPNAKKDKKETENKTEEVIT